MATDFIANIAGESGRKAAGVPSDFVVVSRSTGLPVRIGVHAPVSAMGAVPGTFSSNEKRARHRVRVSST